MLASDCFWLSSLHGYIHLDFFSLMNEHSFLKLVLDLNDQSKKHKIRQSPEALQH